MYTFNICIVVISLASPTISTDYSMKETPSTTSNIDQYIVSNGILAGALSVALVIIVILVVIVALLMVKIKKMK